MDKAKLIEAQVAADAGDFLAVIELARGTYRTDIWSAAMTAHYGPTSLHPSWRGEDGQPSAECLARFADVVSCVEAAKGRVKSLIGYFLRQAT